MCVADHSPLSAERGDLLPALPPGAMATPRRVKPLAYGMRAAMATVAVCGGWYVLKLAHVLHTETPATVTEQGSAAATVVAVQQLTPPSPPPPTPDPPPVESEKNPEAGGIVMASFVTGAMDELLLNWHANVKALGIGACAELRSWCGLFLSASAGR